MPPNLINLPKAEHTLDSNIADNIEKKHAELNKFGVLNVKNSAVIQKQYDAFRFRGHRKNYFTLIQDHYMT